MRINRFFSIAAPVCTRCPSCNDHFDNDKKRKLIDSCGHPRCYSCLFAKEECTMCTKAKGEP